MNGSLGMVMLGNGCVEIREQSIAEILVESSAVSENGVDHGAVKVIEELYHITGFQRFTQSGKLANIAEHHGEFA